MLFQTTQGMGQMIRTFGCNFMVMLWHCAYRNLKPIDVEHIRNLYDVFVSNGWMTEKCFVSDYDAILQYSGVRAKYLQEHSPPGRQCAPNEFASLYFEYQGPKSEGRLWQHFTAGDGEGHVTYDPWPNSVTANEGRLISKRIFRFY